MFQVQTTTAGTITSSYYHFIRSTGIILQELSAVNKAYRINKYHPKEDQYETLVRNI